MRMNFRFLAPLLCALAAASTGTGGEAIAYAPAVRLPEIRISTRVVMPLAQRLGHVRPQTTYAATVRTIGGLFPAVNTIAYDPDITGFIVGETSYSNGFTSTMLRVSRDGHATPLASFSDEVGGVAYDSGTKLAYVTLVHSCEVLTISPMNGTVSFLAGGSCGTTDGDGNAAQFQSPHGIVADPSGQHLYIADRDRLRVVTPAGDVTTLTAPGSLGSQSGFCFFNAGSQGLTYDTDNASVYVADTCAQVIRQVVVSTAVVNTVAGQCISGQTGCTDYDRDGQGVSALFGAPASIAFNPVDHFLYISDSDNNQIRRLDGSGNVVTYAGSGHNEFRNGVGTEAGFNSPQGIIATDKGYLYVADFQNSLIRAVVTSGPSAPPPQHGVQLFDTPTLGATLQGMTATPDGSIWYSEPNVAKVVRVSPNGQQTEYALPSGKDAQLLTTDVSGNVWFSQGSGIGRLSTSGPITVYPIPSGGGVTDLIGSADGNIWFVAGNSSIGFVTPSGSVVQYPTDAAAALAAGLHDDFWTIGENQGVGYIDDVASSGVVEKRYEIENLLGSAELFPIAQGPVNHMWFGQAQSVGEVMSNTLLLYQLPPAPTYNGYWVVSGIVEGSDRALWFTASLAGYLDRMTALGDFTPYEILTARSAPTTIVRAADGQIWFVDPGASKIGRWY